jgi:16S rRNA processing protein RimM
VVTLRFDDGRAPRPAGIRAFRPHKRGAVVAIEGVDTTGDAQPLIGAWLWTARENARLGEGEYLDADLIGCRLLDGERTLGSVAAVRHYPGQDVLELESGALVPFVRAFIREIDLAARTVRVELPRGLVEGEPL